MASIKEFIEKIERLDYIQLVKIRNSFLNLKSDFPFFWKEYEGTGIPTILAFIEDRIKFLTEQESK